MVIAIINNKGGVGKTTTCVNLAAALAKRGNSVLLVDLDSQASASLSLGLKKEDFLPSIAEVLFDNYEGKDAVRFTSIENLDIIPAHPDLASTDLILADLPGRESQLKKALAPLIEKYDFIILDSPPSLSLMTVNAIVASDWFLIPLAPEFLAYEGLKDFLNSVEMVKAEIGSEAKLLGILFTMLNSTNKMSREYKVAMKVIKEVRSKFSIKVFRGIIRRDVKLSEAPAEGKTIFRYAPSAKGAVAYETLATEVVKRIKGTKEGS